MVSDRLLMQALRAADELETVLHSLESRGVELSRHEIKRRLDAVKKIETLKVGA